MEIDNTTLGYILVELGLITDEQLHQIIDLQLKIREESKLGKLCVEQGICTEEQVHLALEEQQRLRTTDPRERALLVAEMAVRRKRRKTLVEQRGRVIDKGEQVFKSISDEYPVIDKLDADDK